MKSTFWSIVGIAIFIIIILMMLSLWSDCRARGGQLVEGIFGPACVRGVEK